MADRFFMRFNLQNSVAHYAPTADLFAALLSEERSEAEAELRDLEGIQAERVAYLREKFGDQLSCLKGKRTLFLGDSISSDVLGYRLSVTRAAELDGIDGSISGATSSVILHPSMRKILEKKPDLISLMIGGNDSVFFLQEGEGLVSSEEYRRNVRMMLKWIAESGAKLLLFEITPVCADRFARHFTSKGKGQTAENIERYNKILREAAREFGFFTIPHTWIQTEEEREAYIELDGIHLTVKGQEVFSEYWLTKAISLYNNKGETV